MNSHGDEFTSERLVHVVATHADRPAGEIATAIVAEVDRHRAGFAPNDDTTVVVVRITA
jgi:serine phosphatase RsbU (regulator of sigma subunit)